MERLYIDYEHAWDGYCKLQSGTMSNYKVMDPDFITPTVGRGILPLSDPAGEYHYLSHIIALLHRIMMKKKQYT